MQVYVKIVHPRTRLQKFAKVLVYSHNCSNFSEKRRPDILLTRKSFLLAKRIKHFLIKYPKGCGFLLNVYDMAAICITDDLCSGLITY